MKAWIRPLFFAALVFSVPAGAYAQTQPADQAGIFDTTGFPLWAKDLRRAEIVTFGSFPFAMFFATTAMDLYRSANHDWDARYRPWPFKPAGAVEMTTDEHKIVLGAAAAASVMVALTDFIVVQVRRRKTEKAAAALPPGSPIIIRKPRSGTEIEPEGGPGGPETP